MVDRYHRQTLLPFIGSDGQARIANSRVLLIGCGALGSVVAEQLIRAGVGHTTIVDRDIVEWTNLQRQVLFDERHAAEGIPKSIAAAERLAAINSHVQIDPRMTDVDAGNIESLATGTHLIIDGTDNAETRYLINDAAVKLSIPWIYGACVGTDGRMMTIRPGTTPCLRCVFPQPPGVGELQTCDTAGVLGPVIAVIAGYQAAAAIKILSGHAEATDAGLLTVDFWKNRSWMIDTCARLPDCVCCQKHEYEFLDRPVQSTAATLCGRNSVQVRASPGTRINLPELADRLAGSGTIESSTYLLRVNLREPAGVLLTVFPDGRCIVQGVTDPARARSIVSRYVGS